MRSWQASALAAPPPAGAPLPRIVVAFANQPYTAPGAAGATGSHYGGDGYRVAQSAQQQVRSVAAAYSLREVASWPIQALSMHCVVFEITNGRPVAEVLAALSKDARVVLAQPLQEFHTLSDSGAARCALQRPALRPADQPRRRSASPAPSSARRERGVRIALIDTGVDASHPDLRGRIVRTRSFIAGAPRPARCATAPPWRG